MQSTDTATGRHPFSFTGSGGEYFRIWIVNILLSIVTLYVYSAWAKVRTRRYFHGNTVLDGSAFEYHARPLQILVGRIVAVALFAAVTFGGILHPFAPLVASGVLLLVLPWAIWRSTMFNARMTSHRNVRFGFDGGLGRMYLYVLVLPFLPLIAAAAVGGMLLATDAGGSAAGGVFALGVVGFYALAPWVHRKLAEYFSDNHRYGRAAFDATLSTGRFYAIYLQSFLLAVVVLLVFAGAVIGAAALSGLTLDGARESLGEVIGDDTEALAGTAILLLYPLLFLVGYFVTAFFRARIRDHLYASTVVDGRVRLESTVRTWPLWWLMIGNLLLLVFTLGLAWPWVEVRKARFFARNTAAFAPEGLHAVIDDERARQNALGEELGDAFDMDMDVGF